MCDVLPVFLVMQTVSGSFLVCHIRGKVREAKAVRRWEKTPLYVARQSNTFLGANRGLVQGSEVETLLCVICGRILAVHPD